MYLVIGFRLLLFSKFGCPFKALQLTTLMGNEKIKGNGNMVSEERTTSDYDEVQLVGSMDVELISDRFEMDLLDVFCHSK